MSASWAAGADLLPITQTGLKPLYEWRQASPGEKRGSQEEGGSGRAAESRQCQQPAPRRSPALGPAGRRRAWLGQLGSVWGADKGVPEKPLPPPVQLTAFSTIHLLGEP